MIVKTLPTVHNPRKTFNFNLEALRGVAAIIVLWDHLFLYTDYLDPTYTYKNTKFFLSAGHICVLIFFLLSGYVIGLAHATPLTSITIVSYIKKRFTRIYPIYLICLLFALAITKSTYSLTTITSHFAMTNGITSPVVWSIAPAWSLAYEVAFYLAFIPVSVFRINPLGLALSLLLLGGINAYLIPVHGIPLLSSYAFGFAFWLCGLSLSRYLRTATASTSYTSMVSLFLLLLALGKLDAPVTLIQRGSIYLTGKSLCLLDMVQPGIIAFRDFAYLPYCAITLVAFAGKAFRWQRQIICLLYFLPSLTFYHYYKSFTQETLFPIILPTIIYLIAILLFIFPMRVEILAERVIKKLIPTGSISYGLYIVHFPILYAFGRVNAFSGTSFTFAIRGIVFLLLSVGAAYLLEKRVQPAIKRFLDTSLA